MMLLILTIDAVYLCFLAIIILRYFYTFKGIISFREYINMHENLNILSHIILFINMAGIICNI